MAILLFLAWAVCAYGLYRVWDRKFRREPPRNSPPSDDDGQG
jgi:hypothetical protein